MNSVAVMGTQGPLALIRRRRRSGRCTRAPALLGTLLMTVAAIQYAEVRHNSVCSVKRTPGISVIFDVLFMNLGIS